MEISKRIALAYPTEKPLNVGAVISIASRDTGITAVRDDYRRILATRFDRRPCSGSHVGLSHILTLTTEDRPVRGGLAKLRVFFVTEGTWCGRDQTPVRRQWRAHLCDTNISRALAAHERRPTFMAWLLLLVEVFFARPGGSRARVKAQYAVRINVGAHTIGFGGLERPRMECASRHPTRCYVRSWVLPAVNCTLRC